jgi:serine/threonine protein kinase
MRCQCSVAGVVATVGAVPHARGARFEDFAGHDACYGRPDMSDRTPPRATDQDGLLLGDLAEGARVGDYLIDCVLPTRGTGHLYKATHRLFPRRAVLRVLPSARTGSRVVSSLLREACIVEALDHPGIPRIYESGMLAERRLWIASEWIDGATLVERMETGGVQSVTAVVAILRDVAAILDYAHGRGIVHRHVVPSAIVMPSVMRRFPLCLVDWSAARTLDATSPLPLFPPQGAQAWLAPEQLSGAPTDGRGDVYALGSIIRSLLAHVGTNVTPPLLHSLLESMLATNPADRPTARQVLDAAGWLASQVDDAVPVALDDAPYMSVEIDTTDDAGAGAVSSHASLITSEATPVVSGEILKIVETW